MYAVCRKYGLSRFESRHHEWMHNHLFLAYPDLDPGQFSALRAANISTEKLACVAVRSGLHHYVRHNAHPLIDQVKCFVDAVKLEIQLVATADPSRRPRSSPMSSSSSPPRFMSMSISTFRNYGWYCIFYQNSSSFFLSETMDVCDHADSNIAIMMAGNFDEAIFKMGFWFW